MPLSDIEIQAALNEGLNDSEVALLGAQSYVALSAWRNGYVSAECTLSLEYVQAEAILAGAPYDDALNFHYSSQLRAWRTGKITIEEACKEFTDDNEQSSAAAMALEDPRIHTINDAKKISTICKAMALSRFSIEDVQKINNWAQGEAVAYYGITINDSLMWTEENYKAMIKAYVHDPSLLQDTIEILGSESVSEDDSDTDYEEDKELKAEKSKKNKEDKARKEK
jgi:hypothetical protein